MATDDNGFKEELAKQYSSSRYPYDYYYYTGEQQLYPYVQPQQLQQQQREELTKDYYSPWNWNPDEDAPSFLRKNEAFLAFLPSSKSRKRRMRRKKQSLIIKQRRQQQQQQREQSLQLELQRLEEERVKWEELKREMADRQLLLFLETDNSFLTPWSWNPEDAPPVDNHASSTSRWMKIEPGSFFSDNLVFSSEDQISEYLSATYGKLDSSGQKSNDSSDQNLIVTDVEQVVNVLLMDQNLPRTNVGTEDEKSEDFSGTNAKLVSDNSTDQIYNNSSIQKPISACVEQVSGEFNVEQIADQYTLKMNRSKKFGPKAKWKKGASKVRRV